MKVSNTNGLSQAMSPLTIHSSCACEGLSQVCPLLCCGFLFFATEPKRSAHGLTLLRQHSVDASDVCDAIGAMSNCLYAWPWQLLLHHDRDRAVEALLQERIREHIV